MRMVETVAEARAALRQAGRPLGLVPTMGYLHAGHQSLIRQARHDNATLAVSLFVNPTQFGPAEDYATYPRDLERDRDLLQQEGVDVVFAPSAQEMYPPGYDTFITIGAIGERLEGAARPGHFRGVATVVAKLLNVLQPDRAYFGQKDGQQVVVIRKLVAELNLPVDVVVLPTIRESDGLALSSRNAYLSATERQAAPVLWRALQAAEQRYRDGERSAERLRAAMRAVLAAEPLVTVDYVSVADAASLEELSAVDRPALASLAVRLGRTRLIDNVLLGTGRE